MRPSGVGGVCGGRSASRQRAGLGSTDQRAQTAMGRNLGGKWCDDRGRPGSATGHPFQHLPAEPKLPGRRRAPEHQPQRIYRWEIWRKYTMEHRTVLRALLPAIDPERNITETLAISLQPTAQSHRKRTQTGIRRWSRPLSDGDYPWRRVPQRMGNHIRRDTPQQHHRVCHHAIFKGNRQ